MLRSGHYRSFLQHFCIIFAKRFDSVERGEGGKGGEACEVSGACFPGCRARHTDISLFLHVLSIFLPSPFGWRKQAAAPNPLFFVVVVVALVRYGG